MSGNKCQHCGLRNWTYARVCDGCGQALPVHETGDGFIREPEKEPGRENRSREVKSPQCLSAFWFACAGSIPGLVIWLLIPKADGQVGFVILWLLAIPSGLAALFGGLLGPRIIDRTEVITAAGAFWRGGLIAFLSFVSLVVILTLSVAGPASMGYLTMLLFVMAYGAVLAGWEAVLIGGLAGWLFYKRHR